MPGLLTWFVLAPLLGAAVIWLLPARAARWLALVAALATAAVSLAVFLPFFQQPGAGFRLIERAVWSDALGAAWLVGADGISAALVLLSGLIGVVAVIASWRTERSPRAYHSLLLLLFAGMNGVFVALDLLVFYVCWEVMLIPMLALIGIWGGEQRRYAAVKFFLYTLAGSVLMLVAIVALWARTPAEGRTVEVAPAVVAAHAVDGRLHGLPITTTADPQRGVTVQTVHVPRGFDIRHLSLQWKAWAAEPFLGTTLAVFAFLACALAFAVKVPLIPLHTWLPHAHVQAPTAISVILAGVLLKLGVYGFLRIAWPICPQVALAAGPWLAGIGTLAILYAAWVALMQDDFKRLVAYSSVSHMGFCLLGLASLTAAGVTGCTVQAFTHGIGSAMLFLLVGVVYDRAHHRRLDGFGGLAKPMPMYAGFLLLAALAAAGLPGLSGFPGEIAVLLGAFTAHPPGAPAALFPWFGVAAAAGVILSAAYLLWMVKRVAFGPLRHPEQAAFPDCDHRELAALIPLGALLLAFGVRPGLLVEVVRPACEALSAQVLSAGGGL
jgi:NADH-quinone oxidoreductase subunit M